MKGNRKMKKPRFLALTALALAMTAANATQAAPDDCSVVLNDPNTSAAVKQEIRAVQAEQQAEAILNQQRTAATADAMKTQAPDVKAQSCFDRFSNFQIVIGLGYPTVDGLVAALMNQLKNQACRIVDQQINNATSGINGQINRATGGGSIPGVGNVGGNVNVGVGQGSAGASPIDVNTRGNNVSGNVAGSVGNRIGQAANGIFR